jgi:hypothetical protein
MILIRFLPVSLLLNMDQDYADRKLSLKGMRQGRAALTP